MYGMSLERVHSQPRGAAIRRTSIERSRLRAPSAIANPDASSPDRAGSRRTTSRHQTHSHLAPSGLRGLLAVRTTTTNPLERAATYIAVLLAFTLFAALASHAEAADTKTPSAVVEGLHETLTQAMKQADALGYQGRFDLIEPAVAQAIDQAFMAQKSIGRHWRKLSEEERTRWLARFGELTVANYAGRFKGHSGEHFTLEGEQDAPHDTKLVKTILVLPNDDDVALNYRLRHTDDGWKIIDIYMNGTVSELSLRRSEYSSTVKRDGFERLIEAIEKKLADFEAGAVEDTGSPIASSTSKTQ